MRARAAIAIAAGFGLLAGRPAIATADNVADVVRGALAAQLPADLGVASVVAPGALATLEVAPDAVTVELPSELRAGRRTMKAVIAAARGRRAQTAWILVSLARATDVAIAERPLAAGEVIAAGDVRVERRATDGAPPAPAALVVGSTVSHDLALGAVVAARDVVLPPPVPRGTAVTVDVVRGAVHVRGAGTLESPARLGDPATVRLTFNRTTLTGTLVAPTRVVVGGLP